MEYNIKDFVDILPQKGGRTGPRGANFANVKALPTNTRKEIKRNLSKMKDIKYINPEERLLLASQITGSGKQ